MITREEADRIRDELLGMLAEDPHNTQRLLTRLEEITHESGIGAHAALLLILTHLGFDDQEAQRHWAKAVAHHGRMTETLERDPGIRVALLDYFVNVNRQLLQPTLIDLEMAHSEALDATRDTRTGLATDRVFRGALQQELRRARRYGEPAAVVLFDLDNFAEANERYGELVGDRLLREAAILLKNNIRDIDLAARPGEDEFALLLPETGRNGALLVADRFRTELQGHFLGREGLADETRFTVSAGIACYPEDALAPETLLERAAQALYHAKAWGKNAVQLYQPERRKFLRFELEPGRFEVEVLEPADRAAGHPRNLSRNGILFLGAEPLNIGEHIEIRLAEASDQAQRSLRVRATVVRLEELPEPLPVPGSAEGDEPAYDRYEIGAAFDLDWGEGIDDLIELLQRAQRHRHAREHGAGSGS